MLKKSLLEYARRAYEEKLCPLNSTRDVAMISPTPNDIISQVVCDLSSHFKCSPTKTGVKTSSDFVTVCDLGCGDGRWLFGFLDSKLFDHNCVCYGVEISDERIEKTVSHFRRKRERVGSGTAIGGSKVKLFEVVKADFLRQVRFSGMDLLIAYLSIEGNRLLKDEIVRVCRRGTVLISVGFKVQGLPIRRQWESVERPHFFAYLYVL